MLTVGKVLNALGASVDPIDLQTPVNGACVDSRIVESGRLFIAMPGENTDGHNFVDQAFVKGAVLALIDHKIDSKFPCFEPSADAVVPELPFSVLVPNTLKALQDLAAWWRAEFDLPVVGITGSVGKSSTKEVIAALLGYKYKVLKNQGNMNNEIGLPLTLLSLNESHQVAVLEMGFYVPGEIDLLCQIAKPRIGVVTNVGTVHAERAGDLDTITQGKAELVEALPEAPDGAAVLNFDDLRVRAMAEKTAAKVISFGLDEQADLWADQVQSSGLKGVHFNAHYQGQAYQLSSELMGKHSVYNMLAATAVALELGMSWEEIIQAFQNQSMLQRTRLFTSKNGALILDDSYNASPTSTMAALELLDELEGEKVAVLGDMLELGKYEAEGHEQVGKLAAKIANQIILVGPRSKMTESAILGAGFDPSHLHWFEAAERAAEFLRTAVIKGQTVLVKGSHGMKMYKIIAVLEEKS